MFSKLAAADMANPEGLFPWGKVSLNFNWSLVVFLKAQFLVHYYFLYTSMILISALKF